MKPTYNKKIFMGVIVDIVDKNTATGKFLVEFRARSEDDKLYVCTIWEKDAERFFSEVKVGDKVHLEGVEKTELELTIKYFKGKEVEGGKKSHTLSVEEIEEYRDRKRKQGFEFIQTQVENGYMVISKPRKYCIKVNGVWEGKLEYIIKVLGPVYVTESLRDFGDIKNSGSFANNANPVSYKRILEDLISVAADSTGDVIERAVEDDFLASIPPINATPAIMEEDALDGMYES